MSHHRGRWPWLARAADLIFPPHCAFCQQLLAASRARLGFCAACEDQLAWIEPPRCTCCGVPFEGFRRDRLPDPQGHRCGPCLAHRPAFEMARAAVRYEGAVREAILALKYGRRLETTRALVELLLRAYEGAYQDARPPELLCPVPLHPSRLRERHFDQARLLAGRLGRSLGLPARPGLLRRTRPTAPQTQLPRAQRRANVKGAFALGRPAGAARGRHILLVDDVVTTGATCDECARLLTRAGARRVDVLSIARTASP